MIVYKIRLWAHHHLWASLMFEQILDPTFSLLNQPFFSYGM